MKFDKIANTQLGEELIKLFEETQAKIADIRFKPEMTNETRLAVIEVIDDAIVNRLKVLRGEKEATEGNDQWN